MSTESETLERDTLEKRSRDELHTIASTLGIKVGSRARKAELVDAILESAGVTSNGTGGSAASHSGEDTAGAAAESADDTRPAGTPSGTIADGAPQSAPGAGGDTGHAGSDGARSAGADAGSDGARTDGADAGADGARTDGADAGSDGARTDGAETGHAGSDGARTDGAETNGSGSDDAARNDDDGPVVRRRRRAAGYSAGPTDDAARAEAARTRPAASADGDGTGGGVTAAPEQTDGSGPAGTDGRSDSTDRRGDEPSSSEQSGGGRSGSGDQSGGGQSGSGEQSNRNKQNDGQSKQNDGQSNRNKDRNQNQNNQNQNNNQNQDGEPGNRRRRRRGRDRDRNQDEGPAPEPVEVSGLLDLRDEGYGFLRTKGFLPSKDDVYISAKQARQLGLRKGDALTGLGRPATRSEKNPAMLRIDTVNGTDPEVARQRPKFEDLTPLFPDQKLRLERDDDPTNMTNRIIDLISPVGKGQRGLIVSPPKAGKTMIIKQIAQAIETNNPECHLIVLLVDERPEEVTDIKRSIQGDVVASTFDRPSDEHTQVAEITIERAKRMVEDGTDVVIILDGITRLARAYNLAAPATGRIMSGGVDSGALYPPKRFFGAARNIEEGGSLTILATALVDTGSKMDEVIFEEFKGTGNMELRLDRRLAERRIYPAIDVDASSTRHEELLFERKQLQQVWKLRRVLSGLSGGDGDGRPGAGLELLLDRLKTFRTNDDFLSEIAKAPSM